jgi:tetratricopeptide (TPR) repeat protein
LSARKKEVEKALVLHKAGKLADARTIYQRVIEQYSRDASTIHLLGLTWLDTPQWRNGTALIEQAIALKPTTAVFHFNLGVGWRNHGEFDQARASFSRAVELRPDYGEAWAAWVETGRNQEDGADLATIVAQLQQPMEDDNRRFFRFAAGKVSADSGNHRIAFENYRQGNALCQGNWKEQSFATTCEELKALFTAEFLAQRSDWGVPEASPLFIVGMPRSGSSLAEQILASHPQVFGAGELKDIPSIVGAMGKRMTPPQPYPRFLPFLPKEVFSGFGMSYLMRIAELAPESGLWSVDKMPSNFMHVGTIRLLFPKARIIHSRRHPLDTCLSCYFQNFATGQEFSNDLPTLGRYFNEYAGMLQHWHQVMPGQVFDLDYESLVAEPESAVRALLEFCELPWDDRCLDFTDTERRVSTASAWQVRQPLHNRSIGRWQHYQQQLAPLIKTIDPAYLPSSP